MRRAAWLLPIVVMAIWASPAAASTVLSLSIEDQARLADLIVVGEVVSQQGVDDPVGGIETEVTLRVIQAFKGDLQPGDAVVFHTRGGEVDGVISEALGEAVFKTGQKTLVFIEDIDGRLYNLGLSMGVWDVNETASGAVFFTRALRDGLETLGETPIERGPVFLQEMASRVRSAVRNGEFDEPLLRERAAHQKER